MLRNGVMVYVAQWSDGCGAAIVYGPYNYVQEDFQGVSPTGHGEGACARGGAAPLSPPRILHSHPIRRTHKRREREYREPHNHTTKENNFPNQEKIFLQPGKQKTPKSSAKSLISR